MPKKSIQTYSLETNKKSNFDTNPFSFQSNTCHFPIASKKQPKNKVEKTSNLSQKRKNIKFWHKPICISIKHNRSKNPNKVTKHKLSFRSKKRDKQHTVLRAARTLLSWGEDSRTRWRERVKTKPKSNGGEEEGTIKSVYSTAMKNKRPQANKHGIQWCVATCTTSEIVHFRKEADEYREQREEDEFFGIGFFWLEWLVWLVVVCLRLRTVASPEEEAAPPFMVVGECWM